MRAIDHNAMHACKGAILKNTQNSLRWQQSCTWSRVRVSSSLYVELVVFLAVYRRTRHVLKCQREVIGRMISQNLKKRWRKREGERKKPQQTRTWTTSPFSGYHLVWKEDTNNNNNNKLYLHDYIEIW